MIIANRSSITGIAVNAAYLAHRNALKDEIMRMVGNSGNHLALRGSWKFDDFHLQPESLTTHSDIDLIALKPLQVEKTNLIDRLEQAIAPRIKIKVSIHQEDHLTHITLADSKIKNIYEYLIYHSNTGHQHAAHSYFKAKIMMLLMKSTERNQRFAQILDELPTTAMQNLYLIKIGLCDQIDLAALEETIAYNADTVSRSFFENCIKCEPSPDYFTHIQQQFLACISVSDWLKAYITRKLNRHAS